MYTLMNVRVMGMEIKSPIDSDITHFDFHSLALQQT